jgi:hypothetical protein
VRATDVAVEPVVEFVAWRHISSEQPSER